MSSNSIAHRYTSTQQELGLSQALLWVPTDAVAEAYRFADKLRIAHLEALLDDAEMVKIMASRNRKVPGAVKRYEDFVGYDKRFTKGGKRHREGAAAYEEYKAAHAEYVTAMLTAIEAAATKREDALDLAAKSYVASQKFKAAERSPVSNAKLKL